MTIDWHKVVYYKDGILYKHGRHRPLLARDGHGAMMFNYNHKTYKTARVIWELFNGPVPEGMCVAYKDRTRPLDPRIGNLYLQTRSQIAGKRKSKRGVNRNVKPTANGKFVVHIGTADKHLGTFDTLESARAAAAAARVRLYGD